MAEIHVVLNYAGVLDYDIVQLIALVAQHPALKIDAQIRLCRPPPYFVGKNAYHGVPHDHPIPSLIKLLIQGQGHAKLHEAPVEKWVSSLKREGRVSLIDDLHGVAPQ